MDSGFLSTVMRQFRDAFRSAFLRGLRRRCLIPATLLAASSALVGSAQAEETYGFHSPFRIRFHGGETYSAPGSFVSFENLRPLRNLEFANGDEAIGYTDVRIGVGSGGVLGNFGAGWKRYFTLTNTIADANIWYDADSFSEDLYHQITVGGQLTSELGSIRTHYYLPVLDDSNVTGYSPLSGDYRFGGRNILLDRDRIQQDAMHGFDVEVGLHLPVNESELEVYLGYYNFESDVEEFDGFSARVEGDLSESILLGVQATYDDVTDANVMATLTWEFRNGWRGTAGDPSIRHRLGEGTRRNYNVVVRTSRIYDPVIATNSAGDPIEIVHAGRAAFGLGDGSVNNPYSSLSDAAADAAGLTDPIVFAHAGSVFDGESVIVPTGGRLLGEGPDHSIVTSEFGTILLPPATGSSLLAELRNSPAAGAIFLSTGAEVRGFSITNAADRGIVADGIAGQVVVADTRIDGAGTAVEITNSSGTYELNNLSIANASGDGILTRDNVGGALINLTGANEIIGVDGSAIVVRGGTSEFRSNGSLMIQNYGRGIHIDNADGSVQFNQPLHIDNGAASLQEAILIENSAASVGFTDVRITDTNRVTVGTPSVVIGGNSGEITFDNLNVSNSQGGGLYAINSDHLTINSGSIFAENATALTLDTIATANVTFGYVNAHNAAVGIRINNSGGSAFTGHFTILGDGTPDSGGIMTNVERGIVVTDSDHINLNHMRIESSIAGVSITDSNNVLVNDMQLSGSGDSWVGIDVHAGRGANIFDAPTILTNNDIRGTGANQIGLDVSTDQILPELELTVGGNNINLSGAGTIGINLLASGNGLGAVHDGDINLTAGADNRVSAATAFKVTEQLAAFVNGQIVVNGVSQP